MMSTPMSTPSLSLTGKTAIVTGGKRGIGRAIALGLAEAGADVAICSRVIEDGRLEAVASEIKGLGRRSLAIQADTSHKADMQNLVQKVMDEFGAIDILVNNAAIQIRERLLNMAEEDWDRITGINLKGYYLCSQAVANKMVEQKKGGRIVNVTSHWGFKPVPETGAYCVAKAGAIMLTRVLAQELSGHNIRVNAIAPGTTKTEMIEHLWENPESHKRLSHTVPLGRLAEPDDCARAALFLASDYASYITGAIIRIDGGWEVTAPVREN